MAVTYTSATDFIAQGADLRAKIARIDAIILALETTALKAAESGNISSYSLNDGQTTISTSYRNPTEVANSIHQFEQIRQRYVNQLDGRVKRLLDSKNLLNNGKRY